MRFPILAVSAVAVTGASAALALLVTRERPTRRGVLDLDISQMPTKLKGKLSPERWRNAQEMWTLAKKVGDAIGSPGLPGFMLAQAYTESRFKLNAVNKQEGDKPNTARGIFQIRPSSGFKSTYFGDWSLIDPTVLFRLPMSVALDAWYIHRLNSWAPNKKDIDWLAIRRGTAFPKLVKDFGEEKQRSRDTRGRFESALSAVGLPKDFMYQKVFQTGYKWPGMKSILQLVGAGSW